MGKGRSRVKVTPLSIEAANEILGMFAGDSRFVVGVGNSLFVENKHGRKFMRVRPDTGYPRFDYGQLGWGGTVALAACELACLIRGESQYSIEQWEWWCGPQVRLQDDPRLLEAVRWHLGIPTVVPKWADAVMDPVSVETVCGYWSNQDRDRIVLVRNLFDSFEVADKFYEVMRDSRDTIFVVTTDDPKKYQAWYERQVPIAGFRVYLRNLWLALVVGNQAEADERVPELLNAKVAKRVLIDQPILSALDLAGDNGGNVYLPYETDDHSDAESGIVKLPGIDWVICGGGADPVHPDWVRSLQEQCRDAQVPFWFEGWGEWVSDKKLDEHGGFLHYKQMRVLPDGRVEGIAGIKDGGEWVYRVGSRHSWHYIDGVTYQQRPEVNW